MKSKIGDIALDPAGVAWMYQSYVTATGKQRIGWLRMRRPTHPPNRLWADVYDEIFNRGITNDKIEIAIELRNEGNLGWRDIAYVMGKYHDIPRSHSTWRNALRGRVADRPRGIPITQQKFTRGASK